MTFRVYTTNGDKYCEFANKIDADRHAISTGTNYVWEIDKTGRFNAIAVNIMQEYRVYYADNITGPYQTFENIDAAMIFAAEVQSTKVHRQVGTGLFEAISTTLPLPPIGIFRVYLRDDPNYHYLVFHSMENAIQAHKEHPGSLIRVVLPELVGKDHYDALLTNVPLPIQATTPATEEQSVHPSGTPPHYAKLAIQPMDYALANNLNMCQGDAIKYITRYKDKNGREDLLKAIHCIEKLMAHEHPTQADIYASMFAPFGHQPADGL